MRRALLNLLENAARYSPRTEPIEVASRADASDLVIWVRDRGPGIPEELQGRIFDPFFQGDAARGDSSGSGLGLSIVQRIAEAHGGTVGVNSSKSGSTFRITLPLNGAGRALESTEVIGDAGRWEGMPVAESARIVPCLVTWAQAEGSRGEPCNSLIPLEALPAKLA